MSSTTIKFGYGNSITQNWAGRTIADLLSNTSIKMALGIGDNVQARVRGQVQPSTYVIQPGDVVDVETVANRKAANVSVTLSHGPGNSITRELPEGTTIRDILTNVSYQQVLGFGRNSVCRIDGAQITDDVVIRHGMVISIETQANTKASKAS